MQKVWKLHRNLSNKVSFSTCLKFWPLKFHVFLNKAFCKKISLFFVLQRFGYFSFRTSCTAFQKTFHVLKVHCTSLATNLIERIIRFFKISFRYFYITSFEAFWQTADVFTFKHKGIFSVSFKMCNFPQIHF